MNALRARSRCWSRAHEELIDLAGVRDHDRRSSGSPITDEFGALSSSPLCRRSAPERSARPHRDPEGAFPREERAALIAGEPHKFGMPSASDTRFNWIHADLAALEPTEARELVVDAWRMVVPKKLSRAYDLTQPDGPG